MTQELLVRDSGVIARAELDVQITTAKAYPRDVDGAIEYAGKLACIDENTAQSCFYVLPRKDKDGKRIEIRGPSIRLAEIFASAWGNIHIATRLVENDGRHITAEGVAWDLEKNVKNSAQIKVSIMFGKAPNQYTANQDMQTVLAGAASSKARRNAIFSVIPKAYVLQVMEKAMRFAVGDQKTINVKVTEIFDKLVKMGLNKDEILEYYGRKSLAEITADDYRSLVGVGVAIKEGHIKVEDVFKPEEDTDDSGSAAEKITRLIAHKKLQVNAVTGEINGDEKQQATT